MIFWMKATTGIVLVGMLYWLYCIVATSLATVPRHPSALWEGFCSRPAWSSSFCISLAVRRRG